MATRLAKGTLLTAIERSEHERLSRFVVDEDSEPLKLFQAAHRDRCFTGDWYGEHAGKWLVAAARATHRTQSSEWAARVGKVVEHLAAQQEPSGYLGTYSADSSARFTHPDAETVRTWDLWTHAWLVLGLLDASAVPGTEPALECARRIGDLLVATFLGTGKSLLRQGNHEGLSALVLLEPLARLSDALGDPRYADLAHQLLKEAEDQGLPFLSAANRPLDVTEIGTGKAYQILWCLRGILALYRVGRDPALLACVEALWANVRESHLNPLGGPWGGIAGHKELFNAPGFFHASGMVETCSSATWMTLSQDLFALTGRSEYLVEIEKTLFNAILGAQDPNGSDWCYFTYPNGPRHNTYHWACCKSSGALALESATAMVATETDGVPSLNLLVSCTIATSAGIEVTATMQGSKLTLSATAPTALSVFIPPYAEIGDLPDSCTVEGAWLYLPELRSEPVTVSFRFPVRVGIQSHRIDHHGQEVFREDYVCVSRGRYVYATGKYAGYKTQDTLRLPRLNPESVLSPVSDEEIELRLAGQEPIRLVPYWLAGDRRDGAWRTTWLQVAWQ